ncbi:MAG: HutD family protein [Curvibacter sp.]|nr:MAG: HutD family protein [Curvibacter sp.]
MKPTSQADMTALHHFDRRSLTAMPWKNGGGVTREIVCQPPGAGLDDFDWRVSIAQIASDGPFSRFAGVDRVITLLEGAGVSLASGDGAVSHRLSTPWQPFAFAGEAAIDSRLLDGPCDDFNVMTRRERCRASVTVLRGDVGQALPSASAGLLMSLQGAWQLCGAETVSLAPDQGLWWQAGAGRFGPWRLTADGPQAALIAVLIEEV